MSTDKTGVASTNLRAVGYDAPSSTLQVEFLNGSEYQYHGVPGHLYEQLMQAPSKGSFLHAYIKNRYAYSRVG